NQTGRLLASWVSFGRCPPMYIGAKPPSLVSHRGRASNKLVPPHSHDPTKPVRCNASCPKHVGRSGAGIAASLSGSVGGVAGHGPEATAGLTPKRSTSDMAHPFVDEAHGRRTVKPSELNSKPRVASTSPERANRVETPPPNVEAARGSLRQSTPSALCQDAGCRVLRSNPSIVAPDADAAALSTGAPANVGSASVGCRQSIVGPASPALIAPLQTVPSLRTVETVFPTTTGVDSVVSDVPKGLCDPPWAPLPLGASV